MSIIVKGKTIYGPNIVTDGLVLYLDAANTKSYPTTGTTWSDLSGYRNNGTLTNGPTFSTLNGGGITFDGVDDYVIGTSDFTTVTSEITIVMWVKVPDMTKRGVLINKYKTTTPYGFSFEIGTASSFWNSTLRFYAQGSNGSYAVDYRGSISLSNNTFYMASAIFAPQSSIMKMYYNATEMTANHANANWTQTTGWVTGTPTYYLGAYSPSVNVYGNQTIYNTMVYNRALSATEISQNYTATKSRFGL
jgi:hypothetical protein